MPSSSVSDSADSSTFKVTRPIVRSFKANHLKEASAHVRAGGHALVWDSPKHARLVVKKPNDETSDLGYWAFLDLGKSSYKVVDSGVLSGLAYLKIPRDSQDIVRRWAERDSIHPGTQRTFELDCLACGACCRDNKVILDDIDVERFTQAGRRDLLQRPYSRKEDGRVVLVLRRDKRCKHLADDNKCGIYTIRPDACSTFPMGSECCLFAREEELGITDGLAAS